jgi:hypothetical protein
LSANLLTWPANDPKSQPPDDSLHAPTVLRDGAGKLFSYGIPRGAGGMTSHYVGVNYWTMADITSSLQMEADEVEALDFVRNVTNSRVYCDEYDPSYHTHPRSASEPAPDQPETAFTALPMCMYGRCEGNCSLNRYFLSTIGLTSKEEQNGWFRNSAFMEYGQGRVRMGHTAVALRVIGGKAVGVHLDNGTHVNLACAREGVLLAAGVMGDAALLLPHLGSYPFFAQPVLIVMDYSLLGGVETCDAGSEGGGTFHWLRDGTGFMSTFGMCTVAGQKRLAWATPQAVNPAVRGVLSSASGTMYATVNYEDPSILSTLKADVQAAARESPWNISLQLGDELQFQHAAYHWTGDASVVDKSKVIGVSSLYVADAMGAVGATSGWTSYNARVAGSLAALRAIRDSAPQPPSSPPHPPQPSAPPSAPPFPPPFPEQPSVGGGGGSGTCNMTELLELREEKQANGY